MPIIKYLRAHPIAPSRLLTLYEDNAIANIDQILEDLRETLRDLVFSDSDQVRRSPLGEGGFGTTQKITFSNDKSLVLKTIAKHAPTEATAIFKAEAEALKGLDHPKIPKLLGTGTAPDGLPYILQQYIPGRNLEQIFKAEGAWGLDEVKEMVRAIASILDYLHGEGLAHRDVKPQNILRNESGYYLVDFGSSKVVNDRTGTVIGSFAYAAPEQVMGKGCARSDIYSLGVTAVHLLTGLNERELVDPATDEWLWVGIYEEKFSDRDFLDLLKLMLERGTSKRPNAAEVLEKLSPKEIVRSDSWEETHEALPEEGVIVLTKTYECYAGLTKLHTEKKIFDAIYSEGSWYHVSHKGKKKLLEPPHEWRYLTQQERGAIASAKDEPHELTRNLSQDEETTLLNSGVCAIGVGTMSHAIATWLPKTPENQLLISGAYIMSWLMLPCALWCTVLWIKRRDA